MLLATSFLTTCAEEVSDELFLAYGGSAADAKVGSADYRFTGWNTKPDGLGINYDSMSALDAIGKDSTISALTLYAQWEGSIVFDANGGIIQAAPGITLPESERGAVGQARASVWKNLNQAMSTGLAGVKSGYHFVLWNTKPDGTGISLEHYDLAENGVTTFYAVYYKSDFEYIGAPQEFVAPIDGTYRFQMYGAAGGFGNTTRTYNGLGGFCSGDIYLKAGTKLYVYVGQQAPSSISYQGSWNGGGASPTGWGADHHGGAGGGATDIRLIGGAWDNPTSLASRIIVAGGGGGAVSLCGMNASAGHGGGLVGAPSVNIGYGSLSGYNTSYGGDQNAGGGHKSGPEGSDTFAFGSFGMGGTAGHCCGGGGGGWFGGGSAYVCGGGGGSSYILDFPGCDRRYADYQHQVAGFDLQITNGRMKQGVNDGPGWAQILLVQRDI